MHVPVSLSDLLSCYVVIGGGVNHFTVVKLTYLNCSHTVLLLNTEISGFFFSQMVSTLFVFPEEVHIVLHIGIFFNKYFFS